MDFDWDQIVKVLSYLIPIIAFILFNVFFKKQREAKRRLSVAKGLLSEIGYNHRLAESFLMQAQRKKFKVATWERNKGKMDYLDQSLFLTLVDAYEIAGGFNLEVEATKKEKSESYLTGINVGRLIGLLAKAKQGLEQWIELNKSQKKMTRG